MAIQHLGIGATFGSHLIDGISNRGVTIRRFGFAKNDPREQARMQELFSTIEGADNYSARPGGISGKYSDIVIVTKKLVLS